MVVSRPKVKQIRKVMATVYLEYVVMRWKIFLAPMTAEQMVDSPGSVSTMSAAPRAASVAPAIQQKPSVVCQNRYVAAERRGILQFVYLEA